MSFSLIAGAIWVILAAIVAGLPMRRQFPPGIVLLLAAPVLIGWIGVEHGWLWVGFGTFAFVSMFRRPLWHIGRRFQSRLTGENEEAAP